MSNVEEYSARECIEYAISCLKNKDSRGCTILWLESALAQMPKPAVSEDVRAAEADLGNRDLDDGC